MYVCVCISLCLGRRLPLLVLLLLFEERGRSQALLLLLFLRTEGGVRVGGPTSVGLALREGAVAVCLLVVRLLTLVLNVLSRGSAGGRDLDNLHSWICGVTHGVVPGVLPGRAGGSEVPVLFLCDDPFVLL